MNYTQKLTDGQVMRIASSILDSHLPLEANGLVCSSSDLWRIVLGASAQQQSIHATCASLENGPSDSLVRSYLNTRLTVENLAEIEDCMNAALAAQIPKRVLKKARDTAIDCHDQAYYGKTEQAEGLWIRAEAKDGTTRFYRVATAYAIWKDQRVTLAIKFVTADHDTVNVLSSLLARLRSLKYGIRTLYLDRGFAGIAVMRYLTQTTRASAVIACAIRGKDGGTRALCRGRKGYRGEHTFGSAEQGEFTAQVAVCRVFTTARRTGRHPRRADWMIFIMIRCNYSPAQVRQAYRRRFGIESSYRAARSARGWTTSPNPALRFLLIALSFFLLNLWIALRWQFAQVKRRGGRCVHEAHLRLSRLLIWITSSLCQTYGSISAIHALEVPID